MSRRDRWRQSIRRDTESEGQASPRARLRRTRTSPRLGCLFGEKRRVAVTEKESSCQIHPFRSLGGAQGSVRRNSSPLASRAAAEPLGPSCSTLGSRLGSNAAPNPVIATRALSGHDVPASGASGGGGSDAEKRALATCTSVRVRTRLTGSVFVAAAMAAAAIAASAAAADGCAASAAELEAAMSGAAPSASPNSLSSGWMAAACARKTPQHNSARHTLATPPRLARVLQSNRSDTPQCARLQFCLEGAEVHVQRFAHVRRGQVQRRRVRED